MCIVGFGLVTFVHRDGEKTCTVSACIGMQHALRQGDTACSRVLNIGCTFFAPKKERRVFFGCGDLAVGMGVGCDGSYDVGMGLKCAIMARIYPRCDLHSLTRR